MLLQGHYPAKLSLDMLHGHVARTATFSCNPVIIDYINNGDAPQQTCSVPPLYQEHWTQGSLSPTAMTALTAHVSVGARLHGKATERSYQEAASGLSSLIAASGFEQCLPYINATTLFSQQETCS